MKTAIIVQARMGSTRLPGKVLADIGGKPLIVHLLERLMVCREAGGIIVAMPLGDYRRELGGVVRNFNIKSAFGFPGDENDVAARFAAVIKRHEIDVFARVCADSPFVDPTLVDTVLRLVRDSGFDFAYTLPSSGGQRVQAIASSVFLRELSDMDTFDREHVLAKFQMRRTSAKCAEVRLGGYGGTLGQVVDTSADLEAVRALYKRHNGNVPLRMMDI